MSKPHHRPKVLPESVRVETTVPVAMGDAIDLIVSMTGTARTTVLRQLLRAGLEAYSLGSSEIASALPTTTYTKEN